MKDENRKQWISTADILGAIIIHGKIWIMYDAIW